MSTLALTGRQIAFELRSIRRNRSALGFTFLFPIMFLLIFGLGGDRTTEFQGGDIPFMQFFVGGILAYGLIGACYTSITMKVVNLREIGVLKRVRGTPLPTVAYLGGQVGASVLTGFLLSAITLLTALLIYRIDVYAHTAFALVTTLAVGAGCFCAMGLALASIVPNADAAPAITNFTFLPIAFISDIFYSTSYAPGWLGTIASIFPVKHLANALQVTLDPRTTGAGFSPIDLLVMLAWGLGATLFAMKRFRWEVTRSAG